MGDGFSETFLRIRSVEPLFVTLGEIREARLEMLSFVLQWKVTSGWIGSNETTPKKNQNQGDTVGGLSAAISQSHRG
jgi:hypothetical protein